MELCSPATSLKVGPWELRSISIIGLTLKTGLNLSSNEPKTIALEDDDPEAMRILCLLLHVNRRAVPSRLRSHELLELARLTDKYDCAGSVKLACHFWISRTGNRSDVTLVMLIEAAYLCDDAVSFRALGKRYVLEYNGSPWHPYSSQDNMLPKLVFGW